MCACDGSPVIWTLARPPGVCVAVTARAAVMRLMSRANARCSLASPGCAARATRWSAERSAATSGTKTEPQRDTCAALKMLICTRSLSACQTYRVFVCPLIKFLLYLPLLNSLLKSCLIRALGSRVDVNSWRHYAVKGAKG